MKTLYYLFVLLLLWSAPWAASQSIADGVRAIEEKIAAYGQTLTQHETWIDRTDATLAAMGRRDESVGERIRAGVAAGIAGQTFRGDPTTAWRPHQGGFELPDDAAGKLFIGGRFFVDGPGLVEGATFRGAILIVRGSAEVRDSTFLHSMVMVAPGASAAIRRNVFIGPHWMAVDWGGGRMGTYGMAAISSWQHVSLEVSDNWIDGGVRSVLVEGRDARGVVGPTVIRGNTFGLNADTGANNRDEQVLFHDPGKFGSIVIAQNNFTSSGRLRRGMPPHKVEYVGPHELNRRAVHVSLWLEKSTHESIVLDLNSAYGELPQCNYVDYAPPAAPSGSESLSLLQTRYTNGTPWQDRGVRWVGDAAVNVRATREAVTHPGQAEPWVNPGVFEVRYREEVK